MQRLRTVTSLDVSAVAGHHAMPAALLFDLECSKCSYKPSVGTRVRCTCYLLEMQYHGIRALDKVVVGHFHIKFEVQKMQFLGLISSQNKIYCSMLHLHSKHMVVFYKQ